MPSHFSSFYHGSRRKTTIPPHWEDTIRPPTWQIFEQNRYTPAKPLMLQMYHVST